MVQATELVMDTVNVNILPALQGLVSKLEMIVKQLELTIFGTTLNIPVL